VSLDELPVAIHVPAVTAAQMAEADRITTEELSIGVELLMENASRQIAAAARAFLGGSVSGKTIVGLIGSGNNGADTAGALRHLAGWGATVRGECATPQERRRETTRLQLNRLLMATSDGRVATVRDVSGGDTPRLEGDLVLDGLLGYSARGAPRDALARIIVVANAGRAPILAVDIPSGIDPDTGVAPGSVIRARATVTLAMPKTGVMAPAGRDFVGALVLADIGIPSLALARVGVDAKSVFEKGDLLRVIT
jgi:NAD(P)H-hydrate epimerase